MYTFTETFSHRLKTSLYITQIVVSTINDIISTIYLEERAYIRYQEYFDSLLKVFTGKIYTCRFFPSPRLSIFGPDRDSRFPEVSSGRTRPVAGAWQWAGLGARGRCAGNRELATRASGMRPSSSINTNKINQKQTGKNQLSFDST